MTGTDLLFFIGILLAAVLLFALPLGIGLRHHFAPSGQLTAASFWRNSLRRWNFLRPGSSAAGKNEDLTHINELLNKAGFFYDTRHDIFSSLLDSWQRKMGYCRIFDEGALAFHMVMDCEPIRFSYGGKQWLIELWKGQYGITTGGEIGVYNLPSGMTDSCYASASDTELLPLSFTLSKNGRTLFRTHGVHWWLTGFVLGEFTDPSELAMDAKIDFPDFQMRDAFVDSLVSSGYEPDEYSVRRSTVRIHFTTPHTPQPSSRGSLRESLVQKTNETNCALFQYFTRKQKRTMDKLAYLESLAPELFGFCMDSLYGKKFYEMIGPRAEENDLEESSPEYWNGCPDCGHSKSENDCPTNCCHRCGNCGPGCCSRYGNCVQNCCCSGCESCVRNCCCFGCGNCVRNCAAANCDCNKPDRSDSGCRK